MAAGAVLYLIVWSVPVIYPRIPHWAQLACYWIGWLTWGMVVVDYAVRLYLAKDRKRFFLTNLISLAVVVAPPLRLLRLFSMLLLIHRRAAAQLRGRVLIYALGGAALVIYCGAVAVLEVERGAPSATITSFGSALWWAIATITTVGYGDTYPVTGFGRAIASVVMIAGIGVFGALTATLSSWLTSTVSADEQAAEAQMLTEIRELKTQIANLNPDS